MTSGAEEKIDIHDPRGTNVLTSEENLVSRTSKVVASLRGKREKRAHYTLIPQHRNGET